MTKGASFCAWPARLPRPNCLTNEMWRTHSGVEMSCATSRGHPETCSTLTLRPLFITINGITALLLSCSYPFPAALSKNRFLSLYSLLRLRLDCRSPYFHSALPPTRPASASLAITTRPLYPPAKDTSQWDLTLRLPPISQKERQRINGELN